MAARPSPSPTPLPSDRPPSLGELPAPIPSLPNLRDVGGHPTRDGRRVRTGRVFRSTDLSRLADPDLEAFAGLGVRVVYDLRTPAERIAQPDRLLAGMTCDRLDVLEDSSEGSPQTLMELFKDVDRATAFLRAHGEGFFEARYREFVRLPSARRAYGRLLVGLADEVRLPALFHCTTGKDRTGWITAALLTWLGVPDDLVMADFLASAVLLEPTVRPFLDGFAAAGGDPELLRPLMDVRPAYLEAAFDEVDSVYGSVERYVTIGLGLDRSIADRLRGLLLEAT
jgi:protein-tyrosine phosphatase